MKKLAIIGHPTRGKEVIEILEMLGGKNENERGYHCGCKNPQLAYYIDDTGRVEFINTCNPNENILRYTLEEFLEKFPYMVGDKVIIKCKNQEAIVDKVVWCCDTITYWLKYNSFIEGNWRTEHLQPYKEKTVEEEEENFGECIEKTIQECLFGKEETRKEIKIEIPKGYEFSGVCNQQMVFTRIQLKYPKTYKECCEVLGLDTMDNDAKGYRADLIICFQELLIARNAYWEIAGEEMGLGKPWKPDFKDDSDKYFICYLKDEIWKSNIRDCNRFLVFPTEKIRDEFYENFKDSIKTCKNLI